jgi:hypothetical protein
MKEEEIQEKYVKGVEYLQLLEVIVKNQEIKFYKHLEEIAMLQFLVERLKELKELETSGLAIKNGDSGDEPLSVELE